MPPLPIQTAADEAPGGLLSVRGLTVDFRARRGETRVAVRRLSFEVAEGECLALVGVAGSGKSSVLQALSGLLPRGARVSSGVADMEGQDLLTLSRRRLARLRAGHIAVLRHDVDRLFDPLYRMRDHVAEAVRHARQPGLGRAERDWLPVFYELGFIEPEILLGRRPDELPPHLLQRTVLAIAVLTGARLILADEPTAGLDAIAESQFLHLLDDLRHRRKLGIVLGTGSFGVARFLADRVTVLYQGGEIESGPTDRVLAEPRSYYTKSLIGCVPRIGEYRPRLGEVGDEALRTANRHVRGAVPRALGGGDVK